MRRLIVVFICALISFSWAQTNGDPELSSFERDIYASEKGILPYRIQEPKNFDTSKTYPLIIFLHGSGERGNDNELQLKHGGSFFASDSIRTKYPAFVVFPQCPDNETWNEVQYNPSGQGDRFQFSEEILPNKNQELLEGLITSLRKELPIDENRIYIGGLSLGGMGTFELVRRNPYLFAAAFPICGAASSSIAPRLSKTPWWIFHGAEDDVVPPKYSIKLFESLENEGADVTISIYGNVHHDSWTNAFNEPGLMPWLFSKTK